MQSRLHLRFSLICILIFLSIPLTVATPTPSSTVAPSLLPGEVNQYQGQSLTSISDYLAYLEAYPSVGIKGTQYIDQNTYQLSLTGLVNNPANYSYTEIIDDYDSTVLVATLPCIMGWSATLLWEGIPIIDIIEQSGGVSSDANTVIFYAYDGYSSSLPLDYIKENNIMIAYKMNNVTLTPELGWPFFVVAKDQYGYKWVEWVTEINLSDDSNYRGYWESRGYPNNATVSGDGQGGGSLDYAVGVLVLVMFVFFAIIVAVLVNRRDKQRIKRT